MIKFAGQNDNGLALKNLLLFICMYIVLVESVFAQCNFQVMAGPDKLVCKPGDAVTLDGRITGNPTEFYWEPTTGLSNSRILTPRATVFGPMTYYLVARGLDNTNLIVNGDFSAGNSGFYTDYTVGTMSCYAAGYLDCEGTYDVITNPQLGHSAWSACGDHTTGSGNMMVLNGAANLQNVWCQQVTVMPDMDYKFTAWCTAVHPASPPVLQISVDGAGVGNIFNSSGAPCNWEQFGADFNSGPNTTIEICIVNLNTSTGGNDFAIDDLVLKKICEVRDTVELDVINIVAEIETPEEVTCDKYIFELDASNSSQGPGWTYQWTASPGKIVSGDKSLRPTIDGPGTYNLTVCSPLPNCCKIVTVEVTGNKIPPNVALSTKDTIGCGKTLALIRTSSNQFNLTYSWSGPNGFISDEKDPLVPEGGWYIVTVTDEYNCIRIDSIRIIESPENPKIDIQFNHINCKIDTARLSAKSSILNTKFEWYGPNQLYQLGDSLVSADSGWFVLKTTTPSGCIRFDSVRIGKDQYKPNALFRTDSLNCVKDSAILRLVNFNAKDSFAIIGPSTPFRFDSSGWLFKTGGLYKLHILSENFCEDSFAFEIVVDTLKPILDASIDSINCQNRTATLIGRSNDPLANYTWIDPGGTVYNQNVLVTQIPGLYRLAVIGNNACKDTITRFIVADTLSPTIEAGVDTINCIRPVVNVVQNKDTNGISFLWNGPFGFTSSQASPILNAAGRYQLEATGKNYCKTILFLDVVEDKLTPVLTGTNDTLRCTMDSIQLNANAVNVTGDLVLSGPGGFFATIPNPYVKTPGSYLIVATNPNGCTDSLRIDIFPDLGKPDLFVVTDTLDCQKTSIVLSAQSSHDSLRYEWSDPTGILGTQKDLSIQRGGNYRVKVTNRSDCFTELDVNIFQDTVRPRFLLTSDSLNCRDQSANLVFNSVENPNLIEWRGPAGFISNQRSPLVTNGGWYVLRLTNDNFCFREDSVFIHQDTLAPTLRILSDTITCLRRQVTLTAQSNASNAIYTWTRPDGSTQNQSSIFTSVAGLFHVTVTGQNHCTNTLSTHVGIDTLTPVLSVANDTLTCIKVNTRLQAQSQRTTDLFSWSGPSGFSSNQQNPLVQTPGIYLLRVTSTNGCESTQIVHILSDTLSPQIFATADSIQCKHPDAEIKVLGFGPLDQIVWRDAQGQIISNSFRQLVSTAGRYFVEVTNPENGCVSKREVVVNADTNLIKDILLQTLQPMCGEEKGSMVVLGLVGGHGGYSYSLDGGLSFSSNPDFKSLLPGKYNLLVRDASGCEFVKAFEMIKLPEVETDLTPVVELQLGEQEQLNLSINLDPSKIKSIVWAPTVGLSCVDCQNPVANPLETTEYIVTVTDENGCVSVSRIRIIVITPEIFVPNIFSPNDDVVNDRVWVHGPENEVIKINQFSIFDRWGNLVFNNRNFYPNQPDQGWDGTYKGERCLPGVYVYFVKAETINGKLLSLEGDLSLIR
ncbi:MAG: gliding motility-associated C-terminal domain-containing protein [Saprospiraceae bacterium]|nr:gliding motility-associated C-terminal domain-containing protein [Saprospiraceae bacterium]